MPSFFFAFKSPSLIITSTMHLRSCFLRNNIQKNIWSASCPYSWTYLFITLFIDRGRNGSPPPLPPNRTGAINAYGSPVKCFHIRTDALGIGLGVLPY